MDIFSENSVSQNITEESILMESADLDDIKNIEAICSYTYSLKKNYLDEGPFI